MEGSISSIETLTGVDGPGIRTIVFMAGCKKRCLYCHNPETWMMMRPNYTSTELATKLLRYKNYFKRGGGITFSGGEPLLQTNFLIEVIKELKKDNIHIAIDTAGDYVGNLEELFNLIDLIILDIKHVNAEGYLNLTKTKIETFNNFLKILNKTNKPVSIRQVIVPGIHDNLDYIKALKEYLKQIKNISEIIFIPYHKYGEEKYKKMNLPYPLEKTKEMDKDICDNLYKQFLEI